MGDDTGGGSPIDRAFGAARNFFNQGNGSGNGPGAGQGQGNGHGWGPPGQFQPPSFNMDEARAFLDRLRNSRPPGAPQPGMPPGGGPPPGVPPVSGTLPGGSPFPGSASPHPHPHPGGGPGRDKPNGMMRPDRGGRGWG